MMPENKPGLDPNYTKLLYCTDIARRMMNVVEDQLRLKQAKSKSPTGADAKPAEADYDYVRDLTTVRALQMSQDPVFKTEMDRQLDAAQMNTVPLFLGVIAEGKKLPNYRTAYEDYMAAAAIEYPKIRAKKIAADFKDGMSMFDQSILSLEAVTVVNKKEASAAKPKQ